MAAKKKVAHKKPSPGVSKKKPPPLPAADNPLLGALGNYGKEGYPKASKHAFDPMGRRC
jgi:hypothetical protein